jgi:hypothetical protein
MINMTIPTTDLANYVAALAREHGIRYVKTANDALAEVITRLADDEITTDKTEDLIVALRRANVIDGATMVSLLGNYLDEGRNVRPIQRP